MKKHLKTYVKKNPNKELKFADWIATMFPDNKKSNLGDSMTIRDEIDARFFNENSEALKVWNDYAKEYNSNTDGIWKTEISNEERLKIKSPGTVHLVNAKGTGGSQGRHTGGAKTRKIKSRRNDSKHNNNRTRHSKK